jgi:hypothetical protein
MPYSFFLNEEEILETLQATLKAVQKDKLNTEEILTIVYQPQAVFRVRSITYCSSSLPGHTEAVRPLFPIPVLASMVFVLTRRLFFISSDPYSKL